MNITVVGIGYVGLVTGVCLAHVGHTVKCFDIDEKKIKLLKSGVTTIYEKDLENLIKKNCHEERLSFTSNYKEAYKDIEVIFIAVGTPSASDGSADITSVLEVSEQIANNIVDDCIIVIKSTVPVGTSDKVEKLIKDNILSNVKVSIVSNPEFMSQGSAVQDMMNPSRIVIGTNNDKAKDILIKLYKPFNAPVVCVTRRSAEMVKYASNDFLALKISYMNEIANLCELVGADVKEVANGMSYDERIGSSFLEAGVGYGGSCLPKDTKALLNMSKQYGYHFKTIEAAIDVNLNQKNILYKKSLKRLKKFKDKTIAILGVTFKPETDDIRQSPAISTIEKLLNEGAYIQVYDPKGTENLKNELLYRGNLTNIDKIYKLKIVGNYMLALENADICYVFTGWKDIKNIKPKDFKERMKSPIVYDGRNLYSIYQMKEAGIEYYTIGQRV